MRGRIPGADALHLSSNDYLAIARHPDIIRSMGRTLRSDGNGLLMSGIFLHGDCPQLKFETGCRRSCAQRPGCCASPAMRRTSG